MPFKLTFTGAPDQKQLCSCPAWDYRLRRWHGFYSAGVPAVNRAGLDSLQQIFDAHFPYAYANRVFRIDGALSPRLFVQHRAIETQSGLNDIELFTGRNQDAVAFSTGCHG